MKSIGQIVKDARIAKRYSYKDLAEMTKIRSSFLEAIESEDWKRLPAFPTVLGFVKSIAPSLHISEKMIVAVLKRDYPPQGESINPKPDVASKPTWSPKLTFFLGLGSVVLIILGYLSFQFIRFKSSPKINLISPKERQVVTEESLTVFGTTGADVKVTVDNQPVLVDEDGKFSVELKVTEETKEITVRAVSRSGIETVIQRPIVVENNL